MASTTPNPSKPRSRHRQGAGGTGGRVLTQLPAQGCKLPVPPMPKPRNWSDQEQQTWQDLWESPQATQWDDSYIPAVAAYICHSQAIYDGTASAWQAQEMRHLGEQLGLTPRGMLALGWEIASE